MSTFAEFIDPLEEFSLDNVSSPDFRVVQINSVWLPIMADNNQGNPVFAYPFDDLVLLAIPCASIKIASTYVVIEKPYNRYVRLICDPNADMGETFQAMANLESGGILDDVEDYSSKIIRQPFTIQPLFSSNTAPVSEASPKHLDAAGKFFYSNNMEGLVQVLRQAIRSASYTIVK